MSKDEIVRIRMFSEGTGVMVSYRGGKYISERLSFTAWAELHLILSRLEAQGVFEEREALPGNGGGFAYNRIVSGGGGHV